MNPKLHDYLSDSMSINNTTQFKINDVFSSLSLELNDFSQLNDINNEDIDESAEDDIFSLEPVEFSVASKLSAISVENDTVHIVLNNGTLQVIVLSEAQNIKTIKIPLLQEDKEAKCLIFTDPLAIHSLISTSTGNNFYYFHKWDAAVLVPQLKGSFVLSVDWFKDDYSNESESMSRAAILGLDDGKIFHIEFIGDDKNKRKSVKFAKEVYQLQKTEPICGIKTEIFPGRSNKSNVIILVTTPTRFYQFIENTSNSFTNLPNNPSTFLSFFSLYGKNFYLLEIEGENASGCLSLYRKYSSYGADSTANSFAWLTSNGTYFGSLSYGSQQAGDSLVDTSNILPYSFKDSFLASHVILTEFHIILLIENRVKAVSRLCGETVFDMELPDGEVAVAMTIDSINGTCWVLTPTKLIEVVITNESRDIWKFLLEQKKFEESIKYCKSSTQKYIVYQAQADYYFDTNRYSLSAVYYAKSKAKIEEIAIKYLAKHDVDSLKTFLYNRLLLISKKIHLHPNTTLKLICNHGCDDSMGSSDDFYKYSEQLILHLPEKLIDTLIRHKSLDPTQLVPALIEYEKIYAVSSVNIKSRSKLIDTNAETRKQNENQALRYLEFVIYQLINQNKALHHYFVSLLIKQETKSESKILEYLEYFADDPVCNLDFVLSLCLKYNRYNGATFIYSSLGYFEDSNDDIDLALIQINKLNKKRDHVHDFTIENVKELHDAELEKRLWLKVIKYIIQEKEDLKYAIEITKKTNLIGVEDLLVYFPSFDSINEIKEILCETLEDYEQQVENLYLDMNESMKNANLINHEISNMGARYSIVAENEPSKKRRELRLANIGGLLTGFDRKPKTDLGNSKAQKNELQLVDAAKELVDLEMKARKELDDLVARECVLCGEPNIKSIITPFVDNEKDQEMILSWSL
ncbi:hypothetical protein BB561_004265 [Smittium simulii]|uniref:Pep3/Vps18 beta-propeller domain-containing protein n=1 Tax=Smittium simulii TaxID=133385 RepID=A0A2T9YH73_9FUNG|nr:hypothetical protein BB561_004265 [Smittium simulii]